VRGYFGRVIEAGWHEVAVRLVHAGEVTASAIDSQVLAVVCREHPDLAAGLRIIESLGPSSIQPLVVARHLPDALKADLLAAMLDLEHDASAKAPLAHGFIRRFTAVNARTYDDIREMQQAAQRANFSRLC
jgi:phosphonate transport system substrate-binding protein